MILFEIMLTVPQFRRLHHWAVMLIKPMALSPTPSNLQGTQLLTQSKDLVLGSVPFYVLCFMFMWRYKHALIFANVQKKYVKAS